MWWIFAALALADTCEEAADRYEHCVGEILGDEMAALAHSKRGQGIPACRKDPRTQELYEVCLPTPGGCQAFLNCLTDTAASMMGDLPETPVEEPVQEGSGPVTVDRPVSPAVQPGRSGAVTGALFDPASRWVVPGASLMVGSDQGLVLVHGTDVVQGRGPAAKGAFSLSVEGEEVALAVSGNGSVGAIRAAEEVRLIDASGALIRALPAGFEPTDVALSPTGKLLALGNADGLHLYEVSSGNKLRTMRPEYSPDAVGFHPDGHIVYSSDPFHHNAFDVASGKQIAEFGGGLAYEFALSPDRKVLWTIGDGVDPPVRWNAETYERLERFPYSELVYVAAMGPAGERWLLDEYLFDMGSGFSWPITGAEVVDGRFAGSDGVQLLTEAGVEHWTLVGPERISQLGGLRRREVVGKGEPGWVLEQLAWAPDGQKLAVAWEDGTVHVWDAAAKKELWSGEIPDRELGKYGLYNYPPVDFAFSADGSELWLLSYDNRVVRWNAISGRPKGLQKLEEMSAGQRLADGRWAIYYDGKLRIGPRPGKGKSTPIDGLDDIGTDPKGTHLVISDYGGEVRVLDGGGRTLWELSLGEEKYAQSLALAPGGKLLAYHDSDERLVMRDLSTGQDRLALDDQYINALGFDPTGRYLWVGSQVLRLFDAATGAEILQLAFAGQFAVHEVAWAPDGSRIAVAQTWETGDYLWMVDMRRLLADRIPTKE